MPSPDSERGLPAVQWLGDGPGEELLDTRPGARERGGRRAGLAVMLAGLVAVAIIVAVAGQHHDHHPRSVAATARPRPTSSAPAPLARPSAVPEGAAPALLAGSRVYLVRGQRLVTRTLGRAAATSVRLGGPGDVAGGTYRLLADLPGRRVWIVNTVPGLVTIFAVDLSGQHQLRELHFEGEVADATVLDRELYVSTGEGVVGITDRASDLLGWLPQRGSRAVVADPTRHRLLVVDASGVPAHVIAVSADLTRSSRAVPLPFLVDDPIGDLSRGDLAVAGGRIWAVGIRSGRGVLVRLDPRTLQPVAQSRLSGRLGRAGALFAASGAGVVVVRTRDADGGGDGAAMWCVDAGSGTVLHSWTGVAGPVVIGPPAGAGPGESVYAVTSGTALQPLSGSDCGQ